MLKILIQCILLLGVFFNLTGQTSEKAERLFNRGLYSEALVKYLRIDSNSLTPEDRLSIGTCYFTTNNIKGIKYLEKYIATRDSINPVVHYYLGSLFHKDYQFEKSIQTLQLFLSTLEKEFADEHIDKETYAQFKGETNVLIKNCNYGKAMLNAPKKVLIENLGDSVNSMNQDYAPVISLDEKDLFFTSRRPEEKNTPRSADGDYYEKIYHSTLTIGSLTEIEEQRTGTGFFNLKTDFEYTTAKILPEIINGKDHNAGIQISNDGQKLYFYRNSDVWTSEKAEETWTTPKKLSEFNSQSFDPSVFITLNEKTMYITSEKKGGFGGLDIYVSHKNNDGDWSEMENLGPQINTDQDDDISYVNPDNKTIYFASKGHTSMGGYDIFKSLLKNGTWGKPINMGSPVNTPHNDAFFIMTPKYNRGYYASERNEGRGGMDIYRLTFSDERNLLVEIAGLVLKGDSLVPTRSKIIMKEVKSSLITMQNSTEINGEYSLLVEHGKEYEMQIETEGFVPYQKVFNIPEQVVYHQLYQEIRHKYLKDSKGNIVGQEVVVDNAFNDIDTELKDDTLKKYYTTEDYSSFIQKASKSSVDHFVDVKFYISQDSLASLFKNDTNLTFVFPEVSDISFLNEENKDFKDPKSSYVQIEKSTLNNLKEKLIISKPIEPKEELIDSITQTERSPTLDKPIVILFEYEKHFIPTHTKKELNSFYSFMLEHPTARFLIKGHTDSNGPASYNQKLSLSRAKQVYNYLIAKGIAKKRLEFKGYGFSQPFAPNALKDNSDNPAGRKLNRRVEFEIIKN
jgi:outer membrane protein OmpA-like peptidoglycan-associated protein